MSTAKITAEKKSNRGSKIFDLQSFATKHRYRLRNLHDGFPVQPVKLKKKVGTQAGYWGDDRYDVIVGRNGYISQDGDKLSICLFYKSKHGVTVSKKRLMGIDAEIVQVGETEISATFPEDRLDEALDLIKVSRIPMRNPAGNPTNFGLRTRKTT